MFSQVGEISVESNVFGRNPVMAASEAYFLVDHGSEPTQEIPISSCTRLLSLEPITFRIEFQGILFIAMGVQIFFDSAKYTGFTTVMLQV